MDRRILVVDDSQLVCQQLSQLLASPDRQIAVASDGTEAMEWLVENRCSLVITDLRLPGMSGLDVIRAIRERELPVTVMVMTGYATVEEAVEAMKLGAYDMILKPIDTMRLEVVVNQALEDRRLIDEVADLRARLRRKYAYHNLSAAARRCSRSSTVWPGSPRRPPPCSSPARPAPARSWSPRPSTQRRHPARQPFVAVNCAALPEHLLESELFGHERGAFTGADRQKQGRFELAHGGTLFLDEIGDMPLGMQAKLLRVLQDGRFERVGGNEPIQASCRVVAATNVNLARGRRRRPVPRGPLLPPQRRRRSSCPRCASGSTTSRSWSTTSSRSSPRTACPRTVSRLALSRLLAYDWPGNVRELEHVLEQAMVTTPGPVIEPDNLPPQIVRNHDEPFTLDFDPTRKLPEITAEFTRRIECAYLQRVLEKYRGRIELSANHCGLSRRSISAKLRRYAIDKRAYKPHTSRRKQFALAGE